MRVKEASFQTVVTDYPGFIRIAVTGPYSRAKVDSLLHRVRAEASRQERARVLVVAGEIALDLTTSDRYALGVEFSRTLPRGVRLAIVVDPAAIDGFAETVARNRGADVGVFGTEAAARAWLIGEEPEASSN